MALTPLGESLQVSGSGFDSLLGAIQNEVNRVQQNREFTRQLEAQKDLALFRSDLEFDMERRRMDEIYPDRLNLEMEATIKQARFQDQLQQQRESQRFDRDVAKILLQDQLRQDAMTAQQGAEGVEGPSFAQMDVAKQRREQRIDNLFGDMFGDPDFPIQPAEAVTYDAENGTWLYRVNQHPFLPARVQPSIMSESELYNFYNEQAQVHSAITTLRNITESDDIIEHGERVEGGREFIGRQKARSLLGQITKRIPHDLDEQGIQEELDKRYRIATDVLASDYRPLRRSETIRRFDENIEPLVSRLITTIRSDLFTNRQREEGLKLPDVINRIEDELSSLDADRDAAKIDRLSRAQNQIDDLIVGLGTMDEFSDMDITNLYIHGERFDINRHNIQKLFGIEPQKFEPTDNVGQRFYERWINPPQEKYPW